MTKSGRYPSYLTCVAQVLSASAQPLTVDALLTKVECQRPITKGARSAIYRAIGQLYQAVPVAPSRYGWLSYLLGDNVFRHTLVGDEVRRGFILLDELEHAIFFPQFFQTHQLDGRKLTIQLLGGSVVEAEAYIERRTWSLRLGMEFVQWIDELGGQGRDDLLIKVDDAVAGRYTFRLQPREVRDASAIQNRNIQLALLAEELVSEDRRSRRSMPTAELAARLIGRGFYRALSPPDDLHYVLHQFSLLRFNSELGYSLNAADMDYAVDPYSQTRSSFDAPSAERFVSVASQEIPGAEDGWDDMLDDAASEFGDGPELMDDSCAGYEAYLESFHLSDGDAEMLSHADFHLLEAELETLTALEHEFGYLLPDQQARKDQLAERLFIDPETLFGSDLDMPDYPDYDEPPYWEN